MKPLDIVVLGLSLSSSWGNGHATTYRALLRGLHQLGHRTLFLERDKPWYSDHRDLPDPGFCDFALYDDLADLTTTHAESIRQADAVIVGSYVPEGDAVLDAILNLAGGTTAFYDIDTPVTLAALAANSCAYLRAAQIPSLDLYLSFTGGPALDQLRAHGARNPQALYCAVDETLYRPIHTAKRWDLGYLGTYSPDRQPALTRLLIEPARRLPHLNFAVAGPQYPETIDWPDNVERIEHLPPADHAGFYGAQRYTLNVTRADMIATGWSPSVRLFEAAACGTPIISDRWPGLTELLPEDQAILIPDDPTAILADPTTRHDIADNARDIVLAGHTGKARAATLAGLLGSKRGALPRTPPRAVALGTHH